MPTQYDYAKDTRSDEQYEANTKIGQYNQAQAINQFLIDYNIETGKKLVCYHIKDKEFQTQGGSWEYQADYELEGDTKTPLEVKVQMAILTETIDIKASQVKKIKDNGVILYALRDKYSLIPAKDIYDNGSIIKSKRFKGKPVYQLKTDAIQWKSWLHKPEFMNYV